MPDSEPTYSRQSIATTLIGVITFIIASELVASAFLPHITSEPPDITQGIYNSPSIDRFWQMQALGLSPLVFTGDSQMQHGLSPHLFDDKLFELTGQRSTSLNMSLSGSFLAIQRVLIQELIIPAKSQTVIWGVTMRSLRPGNTPSQEFSRFKSSPLGSVLTNNSGIIRSISLWLLQHSALVRYRSNIRTWLSGKSYMLEYKPDDRGYRALPGIASRSGDAILSYYVPFSIDSETQNLLAAVGAACRENHVRCVLVNMPLHPDAYQFITSDDEVLYLRTLHSIVDQTGIPLWNFNTELCRGTLADESFNDLTHLNTIGAYKFSRLMAEVYSQQVFGISRKANCVEIYTTVQ